MELCPSLNKSSLTTRKRAVNDLDRIDTEDGDFVLIIRMKVWMVMRSACLGENPNDDSEESADRR